MVYVGFPPTMRARCRDHHWYSSSSTLVSPVHLNSPGWILDFSTVPIRSIPIQWRSRNVEYLAAMHMSVRETTPSVVLQAGQDVLLAASHCQQRVQKRRSSRRHPLVECIDWSVTVCVYNASFGPSPQHNDRDLGRLTINHQTKTIGTPFGRRHCGIRLRQSRRIFDRFAARVSIAFARVSGVQRKPRCRAPKDLL